MGEKTPLGLKLNCSGAFGHLGHVRGGLEPGWGGLHLAWSRAGAGRRPYPGRSRALRGAQDPAVFAPEPVLR